MSGLQLTTSAWTCRFSKRAQLKGRQPGMAGACPATTACAESANASTTRVRAAAEPAGWKLHLDVSQTQRQPLQRQRTFELFFIEVTAICALEQLNMGHQLQVALRSLMSCLVVFLTHTELHNSTL